jgi:hypothetical protein
MQEVRTRITLDDYPVEANRFPLVPVSLTAFGQRRDRINNGGGCFDRGSASVAPPLIRTPVLPTTIACNQRSY